ncbi:hypothetical protein DXU06_17705 [Bradyrhizobium elkanii]
MMTMSSGLAYETTALACTLATPDSFAKIVRRSIVIDVSNNARIVLVAPALLPRKTIQRRGTES